MKVLIITEEYPPQRGGVGVSCQRIARALVSKGHMVTVATPLITEDDRGPIHWGGFLEHDNDHGVRVVKFGPVSKGLPASTPGKIATGMRRMADLLTALIKENNPDIIHAYYAYRAGYLAAITASCTQKPLVLSIRGNDLSRDIYLPDRLAAFQFSYSRAKAVTFVTKRLYDFACALFTDIPSPIYIPNSVQLPDDLPAVDPLPPRSIAYVGALKEKKGTIQLLDAFASLRDTTDANLVLIGGVAKQYEAAAFDEIIAQHPSGDRILMTGGMTRKKALSLLRTARIAVFPSLDDGMPNGLLEAMALGVPLIASTIFNDFLHHGEQALLTNPRDRDDIARCMKELIDNEEMGRDLAARAQAFVSKEHCPSLEASRYEEVYTRCITC